MLLFRACLLERACYLLLNQVRDFFCVVRISAVMALEDAYINAVHGRAPDPKWLSEISSTDFRFRKLVESLVILFSSRLASQAHSNSMGRPTKRWALTRPLAVSVAWASTPGQSVRPAFARS